MLKSINLSLSSSCGADCIFCPKSKYIKENGRVRNMPFELVKKIIDEISSEEFKKNHKVENIEVGENGDAFLNRELIKILRYIKLKLPQVMVELFTNFQHFTNDKAQIILSEKLINEFHCNIDAESEKNFFTTKGLPLVTVKKNLIDFLEIRERFRYESSLTMHVLTLNTYINAVRFYLGFYPVKLKDHRLLRVKDDFRVIKNQWEIFLDPKKDKIIKNVHPFMWAEREKVDWHKLDYKEYACPNLQRIKDEAFITPYGTWYACCYDSNYDLALGNVAAESIDKIYSSQIRTELIEKLERREFQEIGGPCKTVNCCQFIYFDNSSMIKSFKTVLRNRYPYLYFFLKTLKDRIVIMFQSF